MALKVLGVYKGLDDRAQGYRYFQQYGSLLDEAALFQITIRNNGELWGRPSRSLIKEMHNLGIKVLAAISNLPAQGLFSPEVSRRLLRNKEFAGQVWRAIKDLLLSYKFDGVNLDLAKGFPEDRQLFTELIRSWTQQFQQENFLVSLDLPAKTVDEPGDSGQGIFDYQALGETVDQVVIMCAEEYRPGSRPGAIASLPWVTQVLSYALENISPAKIFMALPLYGYDWTSPGRAQVLGFERAQQTARRFGVPLQWDAQQHSTYFTYQLKNQKHTVYFEDLRSLTEKLALAQTQGIGGIAVWEMNLSYAGFWEVLQSYI